MRAAAGPASRVWAGSSSVADGALPQGWRRWGGGRTEEALSPTGIRHHTTRKGRFGLAGWPSPGVRAQTDAQRRGGGSQADCRWLRTSTVFRAGTAGLALMASGPYLAWLALEMLVPPAGQGAVGACPGVRAAARSERPGAAPLGAGPGAGARPARPDSGDRPPGARLNRHATVHSRDCIRASCAVPLRCASSRSP